VHCREIDRELLSPSIARLAEGCLANGQVPPIAGYYLNVVRASLDRGPQSHHDPRGLPLIAEDRANPALGPMEGAAAKKDPCPWLSTDW
jgi:hypothetical protein